MLRKRNLLIHSNLQNCPSTPEGSVHIYGQTKNTSENHQQDEQDRKRQDIQDVFLCFNYPAYPAACDLAHPVNAELTHCFPVKVNKAILEVTLNQ